jgi:hypothetical protein
VLQAEHKGVVDQLRSKGYMLEEEAAPKPQTSNPFDALNLADE